MALMQFKLAITTRCGAKCATCLCHAVDPHRTMPLSRYYEVMEWIALHAKRRDHLFVNSVGDFLCLPDAELYLRRLEGRRLRVCITTNGLHLKRIPRVWKLVISFNGGTRETYERTTGMPFDEVLGNIRRLYPQMHGRQVEIHSLVCATNAGAEKELPALFRGFPGQIRLSYKCENQGGEDLTLPKYRHAERTVCDYLTDTICIDPSGVVVRCSHDFRAEHVVGRLEDGLACLRLRLGDIAREHARGVFPGPCEHCNYNVPITSQLKWVDPLPP
jgi:hypothetical protein